MKIILFTAILALQATLPMKALSSFTVIKVEDKKDIKLDGRSEDDDKKTLVVPFSAYQEEDNQEICVISYDAHSATTISIIDACGETLDSYSSSLFSQQVVSFDISNYANGTYTLVISTPKGTYLTGVFDVN